MSNVEIELKAEFMPKLSDGNQSLFFFTYNVIISNHSMKNIQLISRHWDIEDSLGRKKIVDGEGVVGEKPIIKPGESFEYNSFCPLNSDFGFMSGFYTMKDENGNLFKANIPKCGLVSSSLKN